MEFEIATPTEGDSRRVAEIHVRSMEANPLLHAQFPTEEGVRNLEGFLARHYAAVFRELERHPSSSSNSRALVARHSPSSGLVAAFACSELPAGGEGKDGEKLEDGELKNTEGCRSEYLEQYAALATAAGKDSMKGEDCYHLTFVCTDPRFQRKGAGAALTRAVMSQARADGLPVYLESTAEAVAMYERLGFSTVGGFGMKIPRKGSADPTEDYREVCMVWRPAGHGGTPRAPFPE